MSTRTVLRQAALFEHTVLRVPLQIIDERVMQRYLAEESAVRRVFEHALGAYDRMAESWRSEGDTADGPVAPPSDRAAADEVEQLADELIEEQDTETFAGELAENDDLRHVQAELQAKRLLEEQGE